MRIYFTISSVSCNMDPAQGIALWPTIEFDGLAREKRSSSASRFSPLTLQTHSSYRHTTEVMLMIHRNATVCCPSPDEMDSQSMEDWVWQGQNSNLKVTKIRSSGDAFQRVISPCLDERQYWIVFDRISVNICEAIPRVKVEGFGSVRPGESPR